MTRPIAAEGDYQGIRVAPVEFRSAGETLAGSLYLPADSSAPARRPAVVVAGAWATVKEQMPAGYAREMAARGLIALAFDFRTWGQSGGRQRSMEDPIAKAADIVAAAELLEHHPAVDPAAICALGICAGAGYVARAATQTTLIRSVALIAPALPSRAVVVTNLGGEDALQALVASARDAQAAYERDGSLILVPAVEENDENSAPGADYYTNPDRGLIPEWDNTFNVASWSHWADFDAQASAKDLGSPLLIVHSESAVSPDSVREYISRVPRRVDEVWLPNVTQFDFYDQAGPVNAAADAAAEHFMRTVAGR
jgi:dienelactone hydrolase